MAAYVILRNMELGRRGHTGGPNDDNDFLIALALIAAVLVIIIVLIGPQ